MQDQPADPWHIASSPRGRKKYGQHFLRDKRVLERIVKTIAPSPGDRIVEIGAGSGVLTQPLLEAGADVTAVEIDEALCDHLYSLESRYVNLRAVCGDVLALSVDDIVPDDSPYDVVGNLPYYIAAAVVRRFLEAPHPPKRIVAMMQREVAENMAADSGSMSLLGAAVQFYAESRLLFTVPPQAFSPPPRVWSAVIELDVRPEAPLPAAERESFFILLRAGFRAPRKQLHNALALGLGIEPTASSELLASVGIEPSRRAQTVGLPEWLRLYNAWRKSLAYYEADR
jgi:16S rRNA (adenine1518-N6/adenine1519-N6)-dimethyltransferase